MYYIMVMKILKLFNLRIEIGFTVVLSLWFISCQHVDYIKDLGASMTGHLSETSFGLSCFDDSIGTDIVFGVNRTELPWANGGLVGQKQILDSIDGVGCGYVRFSLSRNNLRDEVRDHILYANQLGLKVMVFLKIGAIEELYPDSIMMRSGEGRFWDQYPQSKIDHGLFDIWIKDILQYWKDAGCEIDVIEVSNEFAWVDFNGDFPVLPLNQGVIYDYTYDWNELPFDVRWGVRKVGDFTKKTRKVAQQKFGINAPRVILGGLNAPFNPQWIVDKGGSIMLPELALEIIKGTAPGQPSGHENYLDSIDGIAMHLYPTPADCSYKPDCSEMVADASVFIANYMEPVNYVTNLPVYLTEFGFRLSMYGPVEDWKRTQLFSAFFQAMKESESDYNWQQAHVFSWDQGDHRLVDTIGQPLHAAKHIFNF